MEAMMLFRA